MVKRAPGRASDSLRLGPVGSAPPRSAPASRAATSILLRAAISPSTPSASAMRRLDERGEPLMGLARAKRVERLVDTLLEVRRQPGGHQQRTGVERDHLGF